MAQQISRWQEMDEEVQYRQALKVTKSEVKVRMGSILMNVRKREKKLLALEFEQIFSLIQPNLRFIV